MFYMARMTRFRRGQWISEQEATFLSWAEASQWLDERRTEVAIGLGRYDEDPYRYELRIQY